MTFVPMNIIFSIFFFRINLIKKNILDPLTYIVKKELFRILLDMLGRVSLLQGKIFGDFLPGDKIFIFLTISLLSNFCKE